MPSKPPVHNIFVRHYRKQEDYWTEAVVKFLSNCNVVALGQLLKLAGLPWGISSSDDVEYACQERGDESVPDAVVLCRRRNFAVAVESKVGEGFRPSQARAHMAYLQRRYPTMRSALILLTNATSRRSGSHAVELGHSTGRCSAVHVSWHDMELLARRVHRSARSAEARFLAEHFASFIREEVEPMTPWTGFTRNFGRDWQHYEEFSAQIRALLKLASDEMAQAIKQIGPGLSARTSGITQNQDYFEKA